MSAAPISLWLVRDTQRLPLGTYALPFKSAVREALRRHKNSLRRLELDGWAIEDHHGNWAPLSEVTGKRAPRKSSALPLVFE